MPNDFERARNLPYSCHSCGGRNPFISPPAIHQSFPVIARERLPRPRQSHISPFSSSRDTRPHGSHTPFPPPASPCQNHRDLPAASTRLSTCFSTDPLYISNDYGEIDRRQSHITHLLTFPPDSSRISYPALGNRLNPLCGLIRPIFLSGSPTGPARACQRSVSPPAKNDGAPPRKKQTWISGNGVPLLPGVVFRLGEKVALDEIYTVQKVLYLFHGNGGRYLDGRHLAAPEGKIQPP